MAPRSKNVTFFLRLARQRLDDARFLMQGKRGTAAVYLAGYTVECALKAMILATVSAGDEQEVLASFRGARAHDYGFLRRMYERRSGQFVGHNVVQQLNRLTIWSTNLRYVAGTMKQVEATQFLKSATEVFQWAQRST